MDSMDIRVINHDHEAIDAIDGPVDEPEAMVIDVPKHNQPEETPRNNNRRVPPKRRRGKLSRKHKASKFNSQDIANYSQELAASMAATIADNPALDGATNKRKAIRIDNWKTNRTIQSQEKKIKKLTNMNIELETDKSELETANVNLEHQLKQAHHANYQDKKASRELFLSQLAELEAHMREVQDEVLKAQVKSIAAEEKAILANQKTKADVRKERGKERAVYKQKLEKELKGKESMKLHMQKQHEKEVERLKMKVKEKEDEVTKERIRSEQRMNIVKEELEKVCLDMSLIRRSVDIALAVIAATRRSSSSSPRTPSPS
jgi:hypothetical protein